MGGYKIFTYVMHLFMNYFFHFELPCVPVHLMPPCNVLTLNIVLFQETSGKPALHRLAEHIAAGILLLTISQPWLNKEKLPRRMGSSNKCYQRQIQKVYAMQAICVEN